MKAMAQFKNKKNGTIVEETLNFYINKLRNNSNFEEIKEKDESKSKVSKKQKEDVESTPQE